MYGNFIINMIIKTIKENFPFLSESDFYIKCFPVDKISYVNKDVYCVFTKPEYYHLLAGFEQEYDNFEIRVRNIGEELFYQDDFDLLLKQMHKHRQEDELDDNIRFSKSSR